jgi:hypothetical protein
VTCWVQLCWYLVIRLHVHLLFLLQQQLLLHQLLMIAWAAQQHPVKPKQTTSKLHVSRAVPQLANRLGYSHQCSAHLLLLGGCRCLLRCTAYSTSNCSAKHYGVHHAHSNDWRITCSYQQPARINCKVILNVPCVTCSLLLLGLFVSEPWPIKFIEFSLSTLYGLAQVIS